MSQPAPGPAGPPPTRHVQVPRTMRLGPFAAGVAVGVVALLAGSSFLPIWGNGSTATPARPPSASASAAPGASPSVVPTPTLTGPLTFGPSGAPTSPVPSVPTETPRPTTVAPTSSEPTTPAPTTSAPTTSAPPKFPDVTGFQECGRSGAGPYAAVGTGNRTTSCPFAVNVWSEYLRLGINGGSGQLSASSPATGKTYEVSCSGSQPAVCRGGNAGYILIYGGRLVRG